MLETANSAITLAKEWRKGGDLPYRLMAVPVSILAILSVARQERPSDLVSEFLIHAGAESLGRWFGPEAPPIIATGSAVLEVALLVVLCLVLLRMLVEQPVREFHEGAEPFEYSRWTLIGRAPATFWFAVLAAVQQGPTTMVMQNAQEISAALPIGLSGSYLVLIIAVLAVRRKSFPSASKGHWTSRSIHLFKCLSSATLLTSIAILLVPVGFLFLALAWVSEPESQHLKDARKERIRQEIENTPVPTGAVGNPLTLPHDTPGTLHP